MSRDQLLDVVQHCYAAALDGEKWVSALDSIAAFTGGVDATLELRHHGAEVPQFFVSGSTLPQDGIADYMAHFAAICPRIGYVDTLPGYSVGYDYGFISEAEMDRDEFYADFLRPRGMRYFLAASLADDGDDTNQVVAVHRTPAQGHATTDDIARMAALLPHMAQALDTFQRLRGQTEQDRLLFETLDHLRCGALLIDGAGRVMHANRAAEAMAGDGDGLAIAPQRLRLADRAARQALDGQLAGILAGTSDAETAVGGDVYARRPSGRPAYCLRLRRLPARPEEQDLQRHNAAAIVFVDDLAAGTVPTAGQVAAALGLTPRQADLAVALYSGHSLRQHAAERDIAFSTARYHLYQLLERLELHSQSELMRLIGRLPASD